MRTAGFEPAHQAINERSAILVFLGGLGFEQRGTGTHILLDRSHVHVYGAVCVCVCVYVCVDLVLYVYVYV